MAGDRRLPPARRRTNALTRRATDLEQYRRPDRNHPSVVALLERLGVDPTTARDLGGTMSLNLAAGANADVVLRVHGGFASRSRIVRSRALRHHLAEAGLTVGVPLPLDGKDVVRAGAWWAEVETFVQHEKPPATWDSYVWMYEAMGRLHRVLSTAPVRLPRPVVATYGPPSSLRRWLAETERATLDDEARHVASSARRLLHQLERHWVPATQLPRQLIHGDVRLGNVATTAADGSVYLDFGFAALRPRVHELAYALLWIILRPDDRGRPDAFPWRDVDELVAAYERGAGVALEPSELAAFGPYLAAVPLYLAAVAGFTPDPSSTLRGEVPSLRIAAWVLDHRPVPRAD